jgi:Zn-dependent protease with chaperone function
MQRINLLRFLLIALAFAWTPAAQADPAALLALQRYDRQLLGIGYRLAMAGGDLCGVKTPQPGFIVHDLAQYPAGDQADARAVFGFAADPLVLAVAPGSPAAAMGLREGDALLSVDGLPVPAAKPKASKSYARMTALLARIDASAADGTVDLVIGRGGERIALSIPTPAGCPSRFQTNASAALASKADGTYVEINTGIFDFAADEAEVAAIVAHEMAHNILRHRARLDAVGIRRGMLGQFGRNARLIRQTEVEADRLSVYLMDRAGYPPEAIIAFWDRYDRTHPLGFLNATTHPKPKSRIAAVHAERARIAEMKAAGRSPRPLFMEGPTLPELR